MTHEQRVLWDAEADRFDDEPDHGLRDPSVWQAWTALLVDLLPPPPARVLDLGSGTGTLAVLLAGLGYEVAALDVSPRMVGLAREKALRHGVNVRFVVGDAGDPDVGDRALSAPFDVVLTRHLLWALPDAAAALDAWMRLLEPGGMLVLIEGFWHTGAGIRAADLLPLVEARTTAAALRVLSHDERLWGGPVTDERYVVTGTASSAGA